MSRLRLSNFLKVTQLKCNRVRTTTQVLGPESITWQAEPESGVSLPDLNPGSTIC